MPNIWHIYHTNHQKPSLSDISNAIIFATYKQCRCIFTTVRTKMVYWLIFFYSLLSLLSLQFILLFSLTDSLLSHLCHRRSSSPILHRRSIIADRHRWSIIADLSPVAFCIVIADLSGHRHRHRRSESTWALTLRWDRSVRHDRGHRCWDLDRGHQRWGQVRSWSWVAGASGFELIGVFSGFGLSWLGCFLGLSWLEC